MSNLLERLKSVVIVRPLNLGELDEAYNGMTIHYRVNLTRGQKMLLYGVRKTADEILKEAEGEQTEEQQRELTERLKRNQQEIFKWWATVLYCDDEPGPLERLIDRVTGRKRGRRLWKAGELGKLAHTSEVLWRWITETVSQRIWQYEIEAEKKVAGGLSATSAAPADSPPTSS